MRDIGKYRGIIPAFYACYDDKGAISIERTKAWAKYMLDAGVKGLYVCGSSGECIYQGVEDRKRTLEAVMDAVGGKLTVIAHVACNNTADSVELARHAESLGVDAIAAIPPIYFHLPERSIAKYWNDISAAAPKTDFVIYNIPQLAGVALTMPLFREMLKNPRVAGVKNSSMPIQDIQMFKAEGGENFAVFNGPDEQIVGGLAIGADGCIGGTYGVMPELYLKIYDLCRAGKYDEARPIQYACNDIIAELCAGKGHMYALIKAVIKARTGLDLGGVRPPLANVEPEDEVHVKAAASMIDEAIKKYC